MKKSKKWKILSHAAKPIKKFLEVEDLKCDGLRTPSKKYIRFFLSNRPSDFYMYRNVGYLFISILCNRRWIAMRMRNFFHEKAVSQSHYHWEISKIKSDNFRFFRELDFHEKWIFRFLNDLMKNFCMEGFLICDYLLN